MKSIANKILAICILLSACDKVENEDPRACFSNKIDGAIVEFNSNCSEGIGKFFWKFGDSAISQETNPTHTYDNPGEYIAKLIITNSFGISDSIADTIFIEGYTVTWSCTNGNSTSNGGNNGTKQRVEASIQNAQQDCEDAGGVFDFSYN